MYSVKDVAFSRTEIEHVTYLGVLLKSAKTVLAYISDNKQKKV